MTHILPSGTEVEIDYGSAMVRGIVVDCLPGQGVDGEPAYILDVLVPARVTRTARSCLLVGGDNEAMR